MGKADKRGAQDAAHLLRDWHSVLENQLRLSAHTVTAYLRDVGSFLAFLESHLGHPPQALDFADLHMRDLRAFLAARRAQGVSARSLNRALSALRRLPLIWKNATCRSPAHLIPFKRKKPRPACRAPWPQKMFYC